MKEVINISALLETELANHYVCMEPLQKPHTNAVSREETNYGRLAQLELNSMPGIP